MVWWERTETSVPFPGSWLSATFFLSVDTTQLPYRLHPHSPMSQKQRNRHANPERSVVLSKNLKPVIFFSQLMSPA